MDAVTHAPSTEVLRAIVDAASDGVVLCDADGAIVLVNAAAREMVPGDVASLLDLRREPGETYETAAGDRLLRVRREIFGIVHQAWYLRDVTAEAARADALRAERERARFLVEAGRRLSASLNTRRCARAATELAAGPLADAAMVVLPPQGMRRTAWLRTSAAGLEEGEIPVTAADQVPGLAEALAGFPPVPSRWLDPQQAPDWLLPAGFGPVGHLLVTPLPGNGVPAGALVLARREGGPSYDEDTETLVRVFAARAGAAISAAVLYQEQSATNAILAGDLLPPALPVIEGLELAGSLRAAQQTALIGGDFYDVLPTPDGPLVTLGDVCGKGPRAAVLAGQVRHSLRALLLLERDPEQLMRLLNRALLSSPTPGSHVTLVLAAVKGGAIDIAVAGHPAPLLLRADGVVEEVDARGSLLGAIKSGVLTLRIATIDLDSGDLLLLYSDGITEAFGGPTGREMYGATRLKTALATCAGLPATAVVERLEQLNSDWLAGGVFDDRALLAIRRSR
ncbi:SpoIIE family protein phosphatase [Herbidospora mongoliensis]|uniref:SpoIIE family protein phosphatase n=1 Tax=Herbidospora mongoliensis TaxID=688067 RepID=UPI0009FF0D2F|nr:SpoIIE family protein phosphatase [Herbidospora mongoliensis]